MNNLFGIMVCAVLMMTPLAAQEVAPPRCDYGSPHPNAPAELDQFGFLIGDYKISFYAWRDGQWAGPQPGNYARWNGYYGLGGMAIIDEWFHPDPATDIDAPRGVNVRMFDPGAGEWDMMWVATGAHQVQDLRAKMKDGELWMWQVYPDRPDFKARFEVTDEDHWARVSYTRDDNGKWVKQFKLAAERIACE